MVPLRSASPANRTRQGAYWTGVCVTHVVGTANIYTLQLTLLGCLHRS